jgi:hypothetical protein
MSVLLLYNIHHCRKNKISIFFVIRNHFAIMSLPVSGQLVLIDPAVHDGQATASLPRIHTHTPPPSDIESRGFASSLFFPVRRIVFGTLRVYCDDHPDGVSVRDYLSRLPHTSFRTLLHPAVLRLPHEQKMFFQYDRTPCPCPLIRCPADGAYSA